MDPSEPAESSDSSDEDYVPDKKTEENVSEVESDGDPEDELSDKDDAIENSRKRTKHTVRSRKKQRHTKADVKVSNNDESKGSEQEKQSIEDLWADFKKDTGFQSKKDIENHSTNKPKLTSVKDNSNKQKSGMKETDKVKITQVFQFAGEEITVEKEVSKDASYGRLINQSTQESTKGRSKGGATSGISGILSQLSKKPKISTLEKSKLDWDRFKKEENIEEELQTHNKGKDGYLERQDFLQRADLRRFEIEKEIRTIERSKRLNNVP